MRGAVRLRESSGPVAIVEARRAGRMRSSRGIPFGDRAAIRVICALGRAVLFVLRLVGRLLEFVVMSVVVLVGGLLYLAGR